ncbi:MAG: SpoIID/LytB domain-containing protein [Deltaproteobacteria bacterium]|nr:SpoIID/LytB domain-containing protein [Deltaproteobacteria bacterium]
MINVSKMLFVSATLWVLMACGVAFGAQPDPAQEHEARYNINEAAYLIEVGKYMEALENYQSALELSRIPKTRIDALLSKATLLSAFLDAPGKALEVYRKVSKEYPQAAEIGRYREGLLLFELDRPSEAKPVLQNYLKAYPIGKFRFQAEALLEQIKKAPPEPTPTPEIKPTPIPKPIPPTELPSPHPGLPSPTPPVKPPSVKLSPRLIPSPELRVRLCKTTGSATISGTNVCAKGFDCKNRFVVKKAGGVLMVNGSRTSGSEMLFESKNPIVVSCGKKKKRVRGNILAKLRKGKLYIINLVDMELYLRSVVPSESYASWPLETLKAQTVAARTYAYYQLRHRKTWAFDVVDDEGDQAYKGMKRETKKTDRAVRETKGQILSYGNKPILAMYSANSGGYTADAGSIFGLEKPYLVAHPDPESLKGKMARWKKTFSVSEVERALNRRGLKIKGLKRIEPAKKGPSGRIIKIRIIADSGTKTVRTRTTLRRALKLPEILLEIKKENGNFVFDGKGWGHGVGYSQWGSAILGKKTSYDKILTFYYPTASLIKRW